MRTCRINIVGASGSGTTTLGRALADALAVPHHDTDDYFWLPTVPPYRRQRDIADRLRLMQEMFLARSDWVVSGSLASWGASITPLLDLVVFLSVRTDVRLARLRDREARHFGAENVAPGGWRHDEAEAFIDWASHCEYGDREGRTLAKHLDWLSKLPCPVLRLDGSRPLPELVAEVRRAPDG